MTSNCWPFHTTLNGSKVRCWCNTPRQRRQKSPYHVHDIVTAAGHVVVMIPDRPVGGPFVQSPSLALEQHFGVFFRVRLFTIYKTVVGYWLEKTEGKFVMDEFWIEDFVLEAVVFPVGSRMVDVVRGRRKIQPPPRESKYSCFSFDLSNLLYLHNCRHDVRRHIREAKCVDIRHKTTCRVTNDTCPLLSSLDESNRTQWNPKLKRSKFEREFGGRNHNKRMKRVSDESLFANLGSFTNQHSKDMFNVSVGNNRSRFKTLGTEIHSTCSTTPTKTRTLSLCPSSVLSETNDKHTCVLDGCREGSEGSTRVDCLLTPHNFTIIQPSAPLFGAKGGIRWRALAPLTQRGGPPEGGSLPNRKRKKIPFFFYTTHTRSGR